MILSAAQLLAALDGAVGTGQEPDGLCGDRGEHRAHLVTEGSLAPFWCTADQTAREPGRSQRRADARSPHHVCRPSRPHGWSPCQGCGKKIYRA